MPHRVFSHSILAEKGRRQCLISAKRNWNICDEIDANIRKNGLPAETKLKPNIEKLNKADSKETWGTVKIRGFIGR